MNEESNVQLATRTMAKSGKPSINDALAAHGDAISAVARAFYELRARLDSVTNQSEDIPIPEQAVGVTGTSKIALDMAAQTASLHQLEAEINHLARTIELD